MTDKHPMLPTRQQLADWESEYFDENQNFDVMMIKAFQSGADLQLEQVIEFLKNDLDKFRLLFKYIPDIDVCAPEIDVESVINDLKKAMRPTTQENN